MKTILDGQGDCFSHFQQGRAAQSDEQVGLKLKRKVLGVLRERDFLKQRRASSRALEALRHRPPPAAGRALSLPAGRQERAPQSETSDRLEGPTGVRVPSAEMVCELPVTSQQQQQQQQQQQLIAHESREATAQEHQDPKQQHPQQQRRQERATEAERRQGSDRKRTEIGEPRARAAGQFQANLDGAASQRPISAGGPSSKLRAQPQQQHQLGPPKVLPNNTLVEDLCKCHANLLPKVTRATAKTVELFEACAPSWLKRRAARGATPAGRLAGHVNKNVAHSDDEREDCEDARADEQAGVADRRPHSSALDERAQTPASAPPAAAPAPTRIKPNGRRRQRRRRLKFAVPETILKLNTSLQPEDYNRALSILANDVRYQLHLLLYRRLQTIWALFSTILCILAPLLLLASLEPLAIAGAGLLWLLLQTLGALVTRQFCAKLDQMLEKAVAQVNSYFMDQNLMLGVINVGGLFARARLVIPLLYFDTAQCREHIESILSVDLRKKSDADGPADKRKLGRLAGRNFALDYSKIGLREIGPGSQMSFAQFQLAKKIVLRYSQRWISFYDRQKLMLAADDASCKPRHLSTGKCLCQFIEEHFKYADFSHELQPVQPAEAAHVIEMASDSGNELGAAAAAAAADRKSRQLEAVLLEMPADANFAYELGGGSLGARKLGSPLSSLFQQEAAAAAAAADDDDENNDEKRCPIGAAATALSLQQQLDLLVPTLSQLVGSRERQAQQQQQQQLRLAAHPVNLGGELEGERLHGFVPHRRRLESNSSAAATERSLDLTEVASCDSTLVAGRNEELIRRLKLLLDVRKDEFSRGLDASNGANGPTNQLAGLGGSGPPTIISNKSLSVDMRQQRSHGGSTQTINLQQEPIGCHTTTTNTATNNSGGLGPISQLGRRFFSQTDGLFFLGGNKKASQSGVYGKRQRVVEIC